MQALQRPRAFAEETVVQNIRQWTTTAATLIWLVALAGPAHAARAGSTGAAAPSWERAVASYDAGAFVKAGTEFYEVWRAEPKELGALFRAAEAYGRAGEVERAQEYYKKLLKLPGVDGATRVRCEALLADLRVRAIESDGGGGSRWPGWTLLAVGGAAAAGGAGLLFSARELHTALDQRLIEVNADGKIVGISLPDAQAEKATIESRYQMGWIAGGSGLALATIGVVWLATGKDSTAMIVPTGRGALVSVQY